MSEGYDEFAVGDLDAGEIDPGSFGYAVEQAGAIGAQRAIEELQSQSAQQHAYDAYAKANQVFLEAERALTAMDPTWPARSDEANAFLNEHPTHIPREALTDPMEAADALWKAAEWTKQDKRERAALLKTGEETAFFERLRTAHNGGSWSARMSSQGWGSIHDGLEDS